MSFASDLFTKTAEFAGNAVDVLSQSTHRTLGTAALIGATAFGAAAQQAPGGFTPDPMTLKPRTVTPVTPARPDPSVLRSVGLGKYTMQSSATVVAPAPVVDTAPRKAEKYKPVRPHVAKEHDRSNNFAGVWISGAGLSFTDGGANFTYGATVPLYKKNAFSAKMTADMTLTGKGIGYAYTANTPFGFSAGSFYTRFNRAALGTVVGVESDGGGDVGGFAGASAKLTCYPGGVNNLVDLASVSAGAKAVGYWGVPLSPYSKLGVTVSAEVNALRALNKSFLNTYFVGPNGLADKNDVLPPYEVKAEAAFMFGDFGSASHKRQQQKLQP